MNAYYVTQCHIHSISIITQYYIFILHNLHLYYSKMSLDSRLLSVPNVPTDEIEVVQEEEYTID